MAQAAQFAASRTREVGDVKRTMARRVRWTAAAEADLARAFAELGAESPHAAERLLDIVETATAMLPRHPGLGRSCLFRSARARNGRSRVLGFATRVVYYRRIRPPGVFPSLP